jgi:hypothetical protein
MQVRSYSVETRQVVIPANAGIQLFQDVLDPGLRPGDSKGRFSKVSRREPTQTCVEILYTYGLDVNLTQYNSILIR